MRRVLRWVVSSVGLLAAVLIVATIVTARFGDTSLYPPRAGTPRVEVFIVGNLHHSGIILPRAALADAAHRQSLVALRVVTERLADEQWLEFGWGDEGFYTRVPTTYQLTTMLALQALFRPGNPSVLHVVGFPEQPRAAYPTAKLAALAVGEEGFTRLAARLDATFARSGRDGSVEEMGRGLYGRSLFYRADGTFSVLRVCGHWVADLLDAAGVPTAPVVATWPDGLLWDLTMRAGAVRLPPAVQH